MNSRLYRLFHYVAGLAILAGVLVGGAHATTAANSRYFTQTGKTVSDPFLAYWDNHGGLAQQGYPITDTYNEVNADDGKTYVTQYFERARFEYHPEQTDPQFQVLLGLLGVEALKAKYGNNPPNAPTEVVPGGGSQLFPATGKTVTGMFLQYWNTHGGLAQQGYPITEAYNELNDADGKTYITQYFQRARFEYHPEQGNPQYQVLLGLVGNEIYARKQQGGGPTPTPTPPPAPSGHWPGLTFTSDIDAVAVWPDANPLYKGKAYFFKGTEYTRYDVPTDKQDPGYPASIAGNWPGLPFTSVDAVAVWPPASKFANKAYFFKGNQYARYDIVADKTDAGYPRPIAGNWPGLPFDSNIDAVAVWPDTGPYANKAYFFKGDQYARYDTVADKTDPGYPKPIAGNWPGLPWTGNLDAVVAWPNGKAYFFKGDQYARYDIAADKTDPGYPASIK